MPQDTTKYFSLQNQDIDSSLESNYGSWHDVHIYYESNSLLKNSWEMTLFCGISIGFLHQNKGKYRSGIIWIYDQKNKDLPEPSPLTAPPSKTVVF